MMIEADGFIFDFPDALDIIVFDEKDREKPSFHGLSHAMKAVDLIVELENDYLFVEVKNFHEPGRYGENAPFNHLREILKYKYRDTFLYRFAEQKLNKPVRYCCLLTLENPLISRMDKEIKRQLPVGVPTPRWKAPIAKACTVLNPEGWNRIFPRWPVKTVTPGGNVQRADTAGIMTDALFTNL